jgi:hypothetical protein
MLNGRGDCCHTFSRPYRENVLAHMMCKKRKTMKRVFNALAITLAGALLSAGGAAAAHAAQAANTGSQETGKPAATTGTNPTKNPTNKTKSSTARHSRPTKGKHHNESEVKPGTPSPQAGAMRKPS